MNYCFQIVISSRFNLQLYEVSQIFIRYQYIILYFHLFTKLYDFTQIMEMDFISQYFVFNSFNKSYFAKNRFFIMIWPKWKTHLIIWFPMESD